MRPQIPMASSAARRAGLFGLLRPLRIGGQVAPALIGRHRGGPGLLHAAGRERQQQNQQGGKLHWANVGKHDKMARGRSPQARFAMKS